MSSQFHLLPSAARLSESLRDLGCSLETAIADVIDNSISADATSIQIFCLPNADEPRFAILDDGVGMSLKVVKDAFRHGQIRILRSDRKALSATLRCRYSLAASKGFGHAREC